MSIEINCWLRVYQEYLARMLKEKYNDVNTRMEKAVHDANTEIAVLQNKLSGNCLDKLFRFYDIFVEVRFRSSAGKP